MTETETEVEEQTEFLYDELSLKAQDAARRSETESQYFLCDDWWDFVYEDAVRMAEMLGVDIHKKDKHGWSIWFSGFYSQGDGATFEGAYRVNWDAVKMIQQETNDPELLRIATALTTMQLTQRLLGFEPFSGAIQSSSHGYNVRTEIHDWGIDEIGEPDETDFQRLMQDFADWIYKQLEAEYDHLHSDEAVAENLRANEIKFDEFGSPI